MSESKTIYVPWFDECRIEVRDVHNWQPEPWEEYYNSFEEAQGVLIGYYQNQISELNGLIKRAKNLKDNG